MLDRIEVCNTFFNLTGINLKIINEETAKSLLMLLPQVLVYINMMYTIIPVNNVENDTITSDYDTLRDTIIASFNPDDDDIVEIAILVAAITDAGLKLQAYELKFGKLDTI